MGIKKLFLTELGKIGDSVSNILPTYGKVGPKATDILVSDLYTGKPLFRESNKVVTGGSLFTASKFFDIDPPTLPPYDGDDPEKTGGSLLRIINADGNYGQYTKPTDKSELSQLRQSERVWLFGVGVGGTGSDASQILDVAYNSRIEPNNLIPFRCINKSGISGIQSAGDTELSKYHGIGYRTLSAASTGASAEYYCYYFKEFDNDPIISLRNISGTSGVDLSSEDLKGFYSIDKANIETMVELNFKITKDECREFFDAANIVEDKSLSSIMLVSSFRRTATIVDPITGGMKTTEIYENFQPVTKLNISKENMSDETKGLDIIYHIYF